MVRRNPANLTGPVNGYGNQSGRRLSYRQDGGEAACGMTGHGMASI